MRWLLGQCGQQEEVEDAEQGGLHSQVLSREEMKQSQLLAALRAAAPPACPVPLEGWMSTDTTWAALTTAHSSPSTH